MSQAHFSLNRIEGRRKRACFQGVRPEIKEGAYYLTGLFAVAFEVVVVKSLACHTPTSTAIAKSFAIAILTMYLLILLDVTKAMFLIESDLPEETNEPSDLQTKHPTQTSETDWPFPDADYYFSRY